jgi:hypothetical protein
MVTTFVGIWPRDLIALIMSGMQSVQAGARTGKARGSLGRASACLFVMGTFEAGIYVAELITDGDHYVPMLETAFIMLFTSWITGAMHLRRIKKAEGRNRWGSQASGA